MLTLHISEFYAYMNFTDYSGLSSAFLILVLIKSQDIAIVLVGFLMKRALYICGKYLILFMTCKYKTHYSLVVLKLIT